MYIPLTKPYWGKEEQRIVVKALGLSHGSGDGPYTKELIIQLKKLTGAKHVIPVTSCTHGLELAMVALGIGRGDEVILPSFTMSSTANAVVLRGAIPVFADIDPKTYNIDPAEIQKRITPKTKGIIIVHYAGMACKMRELSSLARKNKLFLVEDAAHAIGASYKGKPLGTLGDIGVYSFHGTKNISCGEGGVVLTNNAQLAHNMEIYRANGTNRAAFLAGIVDKYSWVGMGTSYFLSDILASIVTIQLKKLPSINNKRTAIAKAYSSGLKGFEHIISLPIVPQGTSPNWHIYAIVFHKKTHRSMFLQLMRKKGIDVAYHYVPLHSSKMGKRLKAYRGSPFDSSHQGPDQLDVFKGVSAKAVMGLEKTRRAALEANSAINNHLPVTDSIWERLVRLPIYPSLIDKEVRYIISSAQHVLSTLQ